MIEEPPGEPHPELERGTEISFRFYGRPAPKGSRKGTGQLYTAKSGRQHEITVDDSKHERTWKQAAMVEARNARAHAHWQLLTGPCELWVWIYREPPKSPLWKANGVPDRVPDADKLARSLGDAFSGILYDDDKRITDLHAIKRYGKPGAFVRLIELVELARSAQKRRR